MLYYYNTLEQYFRKFDGNLVFVILPVCIVLFHLKHGCSQTVAVAWLNQLSSASVWVTRPERPKGVKDEVKQALGLPTRSRGPEGP